MRYSTYLFDFDGTLVDSMGAFVNTILDILDENNIEYGSDFVKIITPLGTAGIARYIMGMGLDLSEDEVIALMHKNAINEYTNNIPAKSNVIDVLKKLKDSGASLNVLTASPHIMLDPCLKRLGIYGLFTNVWSCDDFNTSKTDPEIYRMAAEKMGAEVEDVLFLDDNLNADKTAKSAGMKVCGVYDSYSDEYVEDIKAICDHYIYDFSELLEI